MNQRERSTPQPLPGGAADPAGGPNGASLDAIRETASGLLAAADDAISRVLSGDSQAFNLAARQQGGQ
jgi:hypothetical protein